MNKYIIFSLILVNQTIKVLKQITNVKSWMQFSCYSNIKVKQIF